MTSAGRTHESSPPPALEPIITHSRSRGQHVRSLGQNTHGVRTTHGHGVGLSTYDPPADTRWSPDTKTAYLPTNYLFAKPSVPRVECQQRQQSHYYRHCVVCDPAAGSSRKKKKKHRKKSWTQKHRPPEPVGIAHTPTYGTRNK